MCIECHQHLTDESIIGQLQSSDQYFENWNSTSLDHMYLVCTGVNGQIAQKLAFKVLEDYIQWGKTNSNYGKGFILQGVCPIEDVEMTLERIRNKVAETSLTQDELRKEVFDGQYLKDLVVYNEIEGDMLTRLRSNDGRINKPNNSYCVIV